MSTKRERERREVQMTKAKDWSKQQEQGSENYAYKIPEGMKRFKLVKGTNLFDVIPFIAGKGNPGADEGFGHFERQFSVHTITNPGGKFDHFVCLWECYKEQCDICKRRRDRDCSKEESDILRPKLRHLMLVNDRPGDMKNPLKLFDAVHYNRKLGFGEQLQLAVSAMRGGADFYYPKGGLTIQVMVSNEKFQQADRIDLLPRDHDYPVDVMHDAPCLDDLLIKPKRSVIVQILGLMNGDPESEAESAEEDDPFTNPPSSRKDEEPPKSEEDEEDDEETTSTKKDRSSTTREPTAKDKGFKLGTLVMFKSVECEIKKISEDGTSLSLVDENGKKFIAIAPSECEKVPVADDDEDEPASARNGRATRVKDEDEEEDEPEEEDSSDLEDDEEDDEEEEPAPKVKPKKTGK